MESYLIYLIARLAMSVVRAMPRPNAIRILNALAGMTFRLDRRHRRIAQVNLTIAFPELSAAEHERIARESFKSAARNLLEISRMPGLDRHQIMTLAPYDPEFGMNNYLGARAHGKSVLFLTGHFSAWELLPTAHALHGHPLSFLTRPLDNAPLERYLHRIREAAGNTVIYKRNSARHILAALKAGRDVGILMDQNTFLQEGVFVDFFGLPAATSTSMALLALRTDAPVIPGYLVPKPDQTYAIKFLPAVDLVRTGDRTRDIAVNTAAFNRILEGIIREQPETWLWGHMRWKYRPEGTPDLYGLTIPELRAYLGERATTQPQS